MGSKAANRLRNMLITGGAGFIGSHIATEALAQGHRVAIVDDLSNGSRENVPDGVNFYKVDVSDGTSIAVVMEHEHPDIIFHEAAQPSLRRSIDEPGFDARINIIGTINMIQVAKRIGAHLVFASTSAVYAPDASVPFLESDLHRPNLPYGIAKHSAELYIKNSGVSYTILRYGNVYGPRQKPIGENQLIPHAIRYLRGEEPDFCINGDGEQMRDFVYVKDIAKANLNVGGMRMRGIFNCGTGVGTSVNCVCRMLADIAGKPDLEFPHREGKPGEARHSVLATKLIHETGWRAGTRIEDGLRETWEAWN